MHEERDSCLMLACASAGGSSSCRDLGEEGLDVGLNA